MEQQRGLDAIWFIRLAALSKRLVTMAMWQTGVQPDEIEAMVKAIDRAVWKPRSLPPQQVAITKQFKRALRYNTAALGTPLLHLLRPVADQLHWQQNSNYDDPAFLGSYGFAEFIGPHGHAESDNLRIGLLLMGKNTLYALHSHPAIEIYFVLSGLCRFRKPGHPWRTCTSGLFAHHASGVPHKMETRDEPALLLYFWRGDVQTMATLVEDEI